MEKELYENQSLDLQSDIELDLEQQIEEIAIVNCMKCDVN